MSAAIEAFNAGVRAMKKGDEAEAVEHWQEALGHYPGMLPAARNLVVYFETAGNHERVAELYQSILSFDPYDTTALIRQANAFRNLGQLDAAIANYERSIGIYPYYRFWYSELAEILQSAGRAEDATLWEERASTLSADEAEMAFEDGVRQLRVGNFELAHAIFDAVLEELPGNLEARLYLARALGKLGRDEEALAQFAQSFEMTDAAPALVLVRRARHHIEMNRPDEARQDLEFALQEVPGYGRAQAMLSGLDAAARSGEPVPVANPELSSSDAPSLSAIDTTEHWGGQVRQILRQSLALAGPGGGPGRVALLLEPEAAIASIARDVLAELTSDEHGLYGADTPRLFGVVAQQASGSDAGGLGWTGWVDPSSLGFLSASGWTEASNGLPIDRMLEAVADAGGDEGFNLVLVVSSGRVRADQTETVGLMRRVPVHQVALIGPAQTANDLSLRLSGIAPNWTEVRADA